MSAEAPQTTRQVVETVLLDSQERRRLIAIARSRYGIRPEDAEDLLQETALELLRQRQYVHSPKGYLFTVFDNRCVRFFRSHKRDQRVDLPENVPDAGSDEYGMRRSERGIALRQALCRISSSCRRLLAAYYIEGESMQIIAPRMMLAHSGVSSSINRCLRRLRACLN